MNQTIILLIIIHIHNANTTTTTTTTTNDNNNNNNNDTNINKQHKSPRLVDATLGTSTRDKSTKGSVGRLSYGFLWASCVLTRSSRISQEFRQNSTGFHHTFTGISTEYRIGAP